MSSEIPFIAKVSWKSILYIQRYFRNLFGKEFTLGGGDGKHPSVCYINPDDTNQVSLMPFTWIGEIPGIYIPEEKGGFKLIRGGEWIAVYKGIVYSVDDDAVLSILTDHFMTALGLSGDKDD